MEVRTAYIVVTVYWIAVLALWLWSIGAGA